MIPLKHNFFSCIKNRITVFIIILYIIGIIYGNSFGAFFVVPAIIMLGLMLTFLTVSKSFRKRFGVIPLCAAIFFLIGNLHIDYVSALKYHDLRNFAGKNCWIYGIVTSDAELTEKQNHYCYTVDVHEIESDGKREKASGTIMLYVSRYYDEVPHINQPIYCFADIETPNYADGSFDYGVYLKAKDIYVTGFTYKVYPDSSENINFTIPSRIKCFGRRINAFLQNRIEDVFGYDGDACAIMKGILLGANSDLSESLTDNLSLAGFSHITAVSGLHLNILFGAFCGLLGFFKFHRKLISLLALPIILLFAATTGFSPSICRAAIMLTLCIIATVTKNQYDSLTALFISAFIILLFNPYSLFSISFILSFSSTLAIIMLYPKIYGLFVRPARKSYILKSIFALVSVSLSAFIGTAPFIAYYFGIVSFASLIANIWIVPICGPIFILGYVLCFIHPVLNAPICNIFLYPAAAGIKVILKTAEIFADLKFLHFNVKEFSPWYIVIYFVVVVLLYLGSNEEKRQQQSEHTE